MYRPTEWLSLLGGQSAPEGRLAVRVTQLSVFNCRFESNICV